MNARRENSPFAVGSSEKTAILCGVSVFRTKLALYLAAPLCPWNAAEIL